jgi:hypothetical protein
MFQSRRVSGRKFAVCLASLLALLAVALTSAWPQASTGNLVVDLWQTFEFDTLNVANLDAHDGVSGQGAWSIVDASRAFSIGPAAENKTEGTINGMPDFGSRGLLDDGSKSGDMRVRWDFNSASRPLAMSFGFWFKVDDEFVGSYDEHDIIVVRRAMSSTNLYLKLTDDEQARIHIFCESRGYSAPILISPNTWYWVTGWWKLPDMAMAFRVYNVAREQVGSEQRINASPVNDRIGYFSVGSHIGPTDGDTTGFLYFDDVMADWTDATYPLGPGAPPSDNEPPSIPTGLSANAVSADQIDLAWSASSDDSAVSYRVFRDGVEVENTADTFYSDTGLTAQTEYSYTVRAYDEAGNESSPSDPVTETTGSFYKAAPPTFSPPGGTYQAAQSVTLATTSAGAAIYYTTDGSTPNTSSTAYSSPIPVQQFTVINAIAAGPDWVDSNVSTATYALRAAAPIISPAAGTYNAPLAVTLAHPDPNVTIYYTTNNAAPTTSSAVYSGPIPVSATTTVRAIAAAAGWTSSVEASSTYTLRAATPTFSPSGGTYVGAQSVTISSTSPGASIYYTTNGSTPTTSSTVYVGPIPVSTTTTIRAIAAAAGWTNSTAGSATYTITTSQAAAPTFSPAGGTYNAPQNVTLASTSPGVTIYYTTNGSTPTTSSTVYSGPIPVTRTTTIRARAAGAGWTNSTVGSATYTLRVATPTFSIPGGTYNTPQSVVLASASPGAAIYYTLNGNTPTTNSTRYTGSIAITRTRKVRAIAVISGWKNSTIAAATYTLRAAAPTFSPPGGTYNGTQLVTLSSASPGVTIYYTTNGSTPTTSSTRYTGPISVPSSRTIRAMAAANNWTNSTRTSATYTIN